MKRFRHLLALLLSLMLLSGLAVPAVANEGNGMTPPPPQWTSTQTYDWYTVVEAATERSTGKAATQLFTFEVKANVSRLTVVNDGVYNLDLALNGQRFHIDSDFEKGKGTAAYDISGLVKYGVNTLEVQSLAKPGGMATFKVEAPALNARILHTNDIHAKIDPLPKMSAYVKAAKAQGGNVYFINAGDIFSGNPVSDLNKGVPMIQALNRMATDLMAVGNHDFDHGPEATQARRTESNFPWLSANTVVKDQALTPIQPFEPYKIVTTELGQRIAFIGLTETPPSTAKKNTVGLDFVSPVAEVQKQINALRDQVNLVVIVSHNGNDFDHAMAEQITGADLILGAHSHTYLPEPEWVNGIPIIQVGSNATYLSDLVVRQAESVSVNPGAAGGKHTVRIASLTAEDPEVKEVVDYWNAQMAPILDTVIGTTLNALTQSGKENGDVAIGNLITDGLRDYLGTDLAFWNNGGIRADIPKGDITMKQVYTVLPFGNFIWKVEATGAEIVHAITRSYARPNRNPAVDLQISGGSYTVLTKPDGTPERIDVKVNGQPIDLAATYTLAVSDFAATSGTYFETVPTVIDVGSDVDAIAVAEYIKKVGTLNYRSSEGRIVVKAAPTPVAVTKVNVFNSGSLLAADAAGNLVPLTNQATMLLTTESTGYQVDRSSDAPHFPMVDAGRPVPLAAFEQIGSGKVIALGTNLAANQQRHQTWQWFTNLLDWAGGAQTGTVLVDEGHNQFYDAGRYSSARSFLADRGWTLTFTGKNTALTAAKLQGVKVLLISAPQSSYTAAEHQVIRDYVFSGGSVIFTSGTDFYATNNATELNALAAAVGTVLRFNSDEVRDSVSKEGTTLWSVNTDEFNPAYPELLKAR